jgi:hypothetical protein
LIVHLFCFRVKKRFGLGIFERNGYNFPVSSAAR